MKLNILIFSVFVFASSCSDSANNKKGTETGNQSTNKTPGEMRHRDGDEEKYPAQARQPVNTPSITVDVKTYQEPQGWGYDLYVNGKKSIHQPTIPALPGNQGFVSEKQAYQVGDLMALKIKHNTMPPAVSIAELDSLKIGYKR